MACCALTAIFATADGSCAAGRLQAAPIFGYRCCPRIDGALSTIAAGARLLNPFALLSSCKRGCWAREAADRSRFDRSGSSTSAESTAALAT